MGHPEHAVSEQGRGGRAGTGRLPGHHGNGRTIERNGFGPLQEDDPSLAMTDDPFVAAWFSGLRTGQKESYQMLKVDGHQYTKNFGMAVTGRSFVCTEDGLMGPALGTTSVGDVVVIIVGDNTPCLAFSSREG